MKYQNLLSPKGICFHEWTNSHKYINKYINSKITKQNVKQKVLNVGIHPSHAVSGECLHPAGTEASPLQGQRGTIGVSLIVAPWVDTSSFDRQLLSAQWRPGPAIIHVKLYMHASYATHPVEIHVIRHAQYARFNLPVPLLPVPRTKGLMKTDGSPSRRSHPIPPDLPSQPPHPPLYPILSFGHFWWHSIREGSSNSIGF